jgi:hypothetical protein
VRDFANWFPQQNRRDHCCSKQQRANRQSSPQQMSRPTLSAPWNNCPERDAIFVGEYSPVFDFQQRFADHFRQHNQILWPLIRIRMQHPGKQGSQGFWKL